MSTLGLLQLLDVIVSDCVPPLSVLRMGPRYLTLEEVSSVMSLLAKKEVVLIRRPSLVVRGNDVPEILSCTSLPNAILASPMSE
jgi:hypothetical protein